MELTPRTVDEPAAARRSGRRRRGAVVVAVALVAVGVIAWQGLTSASEYFYNADEAAAKHDELGSKRFRVQGTVVGGTVERAEGGASFDIAFNGVSIPVTHQGGTPELFDSGIPVVLSGHWDGDRFASDQILVKHSERYEAENEDRLREARAGSGPGASASPP